MTQQFRNIKLRVDGHDQVRAALTFLFADGCRWAGSGGVNVEYRLDATHLFVGTTGLVTYIDDNDDVYFLSHHGKEIIPRWDVVTTTTVTMSVPERPKTVLFGKTYFTDELNARLAGLETAK